MLQLVTDVGLEELCFDSWGELLASPALMVAGRREKCSLYKRVLENNDICSLLREGEGDCVNTIKFVCYAHIK